MLSNAYHRLEPVLQRQEHPCLLHREQLLQTRDVHTGHGRKPYCPKTVQMLSQLFIYRIQRWPGWLDSQVKFLGDDLLVRLPVLVFVV